MKENRFLIFIVKFVGTIVIFFVCDLALQYFDAGVVSYGKAARFALIFGTALAVGRESIDYFRRKKAINI